MKKVSPRHAEKVHHAKKGLQQKVQQMVPAKGSTKIVKIFFYDRCYTKVFSTRVANGFTTGFTMSCPCGFTWVLLKKIQKVCKRFRKGISFAKGVTKNFKTGFTKCVTRGFTRSFTRRF